MEAIIERVIRDDVKDKKGHGKKDVKLTESALKTDEELKEIVEGIKASIKIVGAGGAGGNTVSRLMKMGIEGGDVVAVNTDAIDLLKTAAFTKVLIGQKVTRGLGAGNTPELGEKAAREDVEKIAEALKGADMVFITCGLGGGTGTGSAPIIAEVAKDTGALTIGVVTLPFSIEGSYRAKNALQGLEKLRDIVDTLIVIPNDRLLDIVPTLPLDSAFKVADEILANAAKGITEMITKVGLVNLDFADIKTILTDGGTAIIGLGQSSPDAKPEERARQAVDAALHSPLLDADIKSAKGALIEIVGGRDLSLREVDQSVRMVAESIDPSAQVIWGAQIEDKAESTSVKVMVVIAGVSTPLFEEELKRRAEIRKEQSESFELKSV